MKTLLAGLVLLLSGFRPAAADSAPPPGPVVGIGIVIKAVDHHPVIEQVIPGNPAAKSGLKAGDRIVKIDGADADGLDLGQIAERLRGAAGTHVKVTVQRDGHAHTFRVKRQIITLKAPNSDSSAP